MTTGGFVESIFWIGLVIFIGEAYSQGRAWAKAVVVVAAIAAFLAIMLTQQGP